MAYKFCSFELKGGGGGGGGGIKMHWRNVLSPQHVGVTLIIWKQYGEDTFLEILSQN